MRTRFCLCPRRVCFPVLCKFWRLCGEVMGNLLQEGLCHTQICCTQGPHPCGIPLLTGASSGVAAAQHWKEDVPHVYRQRSPSKMVDAGAVTQQETDSDLPVSVQESPKEAGVDGGLLQGRGH